MDFGKEMERIWKDFGGTGNCNHNILYKKLYFPLERWDGRHKWISGLRFQLSAPKLLLSCFLINQWCDEVHGSEEQQSQFSLKQAGSLCFMSSEGRAGGRTEAQRSYPAGEGQG